jgi:hypothetical protein
MLPWVRPIDSRGLAHEQLEEPDVAGALGADALDHQQLLDAGGATPREVDLGHAAARERADQLVAAQDADLVGHGDVDDSIHATARRRRRRRFDRAGGGA